MRSEIYDERGGDLPVKREEESEERRRKVNGGRREGGRSGVGK